MESQRLAADTALLSEVARDRAILAERAAALNGVPIHPMRLAHELQALLSDDMTLCLDMGSFHIWLARHLYTFRPRQILMTNGQQTLGVGLPWAIAACLVRPGEKVISISGDGGFLFSAMELETAVRLKCNIVHLVWIDGFYDMVGIQEIAKYGRLSGVALGPVDVVRFAEAFGAKGLRIETPDQISSTSKAASGWWRLGVAAVGKGGSVRRTRYRRSARRHRRFTDRLRGKTRWSPYGRDPRAATPARSKSRNLCVPRRPAVERFQRVVRSSGR